MSSPWSTPPAGGNVIVTTTSTVEGRNVVAYLGLVSGQAILGANVFRDLFASIRDIVGGRSAPMRACCATVARRRWARW